MNAASDNPTLLAALDYATKGFPVFPCSPKDKTPLVDSGFKAASKDPEQIRNWWRQWPRAMVGVPTGPGTGFVIDLDLGSPAVITGPEYLARFAEHAGPIPPTAIAETGSGGYHVWFAWDPHSPVRNGANVVPSLHIPPAEGAIGRDGKKAKGAQIDIRGEGGYVIVPPSVREDGGAYSWCPGPEDGIAAATERLLRIARKEERTARAEALHVSPLPPTGEIARRYALAGLDNEAVRRYALAGLDKETRAVASAMAGSRNDALNTAAVKLFSLAGAGAISEGIVHAALEDAARQNGLIKDDGLASVRATIASGATAGLAKPRDLSKISAKPKLHSKTAQRPSRPNGGLDTATGEDWRGLLQCSARSGYPKGNLVNALIALRHAPEWSGVLCYDEFALSTWLERAPPWHKGSFHARTWTPLDTTLVTEWLQLQDINVGTDIARMAVDAASQEKPFHPVRDYLAALQWDGHRRVDNWLTTYLGADPSPYAAAIGRCFLISAVARIMDPGCKVDHMLMLEGDQGVSKSEAVRILGGEWFCPDLPELGTKDASLALSGRWIFEVEELDAMTRADSNTIKRFVSKRGDRFRRPYGTQVEDITRQCVFIGTTNESAYLNDPTGGRRFWPVRISAIDTAALAQDRDQIWAEAVHAYRAGEQWWLTNPDILHQARQEQAERQVEMPWESLVERFIGNLSSVSVEEVLIECIGKPKERWEQKDFNLVSRVLKKLGWEKYRARLGDGRRDNRYRPIAAGP